MKRCTIIGGADIADYQRISEYIRNDDYVIYCDSGLKHRSGLKSEPSLIVGDFDSYENPCLQTETIVLPTEKDDTDTLFAVKEGVRRGFEDFLLLGVTGGRLDHTLGNVYILLYLDSLGKSALLVDDLSEMEIVSSLTKEISCDFSFFSLINIMGTARGITIRNAKYPLNDAEISCEYQYGISNEVLPGKKALVSVSEGKLLLIRVF